MYFIRQKKRKKEKGNIYVWEKELREEDEEREENDKKNDSKVLTRHFLTRHANIPIWFF